MIRTLANRQYGYFLDLTLIGLFAGTFIFSLMIGIAQGAGPSAIAKQRVFNKDLPVTINEIPPGHLRRQLESLPIPARERALGWLRRFQFPEADVAHLRADPQGGIFYEDPAVDGSMVAEGGETNPVLAELTVTSVFTLHSKPGASRTVYLDMDGHVVSGTAWNNSSQVDSLYMSPYDTDGYESTFSKEELEDIAEIWKRVAEDYASFDIDVTTEEPISFGANVGHILVSPKTDEYNNKIYDCSCGGVAYIGVWGASYFPTYQPALVFPESLRYSPHSISEAASHELGHNLGLSHDGTSTTEYYPGHGAGNIDWAPIMGVGYYANVTQWSKGEYADANNQQDDIEIIRGHLGYRGDDHEDLDFAFATPLVRSGATAIAATNPVTDQDNFYPSNKGIIEDRSDVDMFFVDVGAGTIDLTVTPVWIDSFWLQSFRGANLDIQATLYDEISGYQMAQSNPVDDTSARVTANVPAGRYILAVEGVGVGTTSSGYSDYGSLSQYFINGTVPEDIIYSAPPAAPIDLAVSLSDEVSISLTWTDPESTFENNEVGYRVFRQKDGGAFIQVASLGQNSSGYADNNLTNGSYIYQVETFNGAGSNWTNATNALVIDLPDAVNVSSETTITGQILFGSYLDTATESGSEVLAELHQGGKPSNRNSALEHIWTLTGVQPGAIITLEVDAEAPANSENDDFTFFFAVNGGAYTELGTLWNGTIRQTFSKVLPPTTSGTVTVRVVDTDRTPGRSEIDTLTVHRINVISAGNPDNMVPVVTIKEPLGGQQAAEGTPIVFTATADDYEDGDLTGAITWTSDLDGTIGVGPNQTVMSLSVGTHMITASVSDATGNRGEDSVVVNITDANAATTVKVSNLSVTSSAAPGKKWTAEILVNVEDNLGEAVLGATVNGYWSGNAADLASCTTDVLGKCSIRKEALKMNESTVYFSVSGISHTSLSYDNSGMVSIFATSPY